MRADLETAMGVALTSRSRCARLVQAPAEYAAAFDLDEDERRALILMAGDLAALMPRFVAKRQRGLRHALPVTLQLAEESAGPGTIQSMLDRYCETQPPPPTRAADLMSFADFVAGETEFLAVGVPHGAVTAQMARFERLRLRASAAEGPLWPTDTTAGPLRLHPSASWDTFRWDLRRLRHAQDIPALRAGPCVLLCIQRSEDGRIRSMRLDPAAGRIIEVIGRSREPLTASRACALPGTRERPDALLGRLIAEGVVVGAVP